MSQTLSVPLASKQAEVMVRWSNPETWGGRLPEAGESVVIPANRRVLLDVSPPALKSLQVNGYLQFDDLNLNLMADWILVRGELRVGTANHPHTRKAAIVLTAEDAHENIMGLGTKFLAAIGGGVIALHGELRVKRASLSAVAEAGMTHIVVDRWVDWRPGDRVQIQPARDQLGPIEDRTVIGVDEQILALDRPLAHQHNGAPSRPTGPLLDHRSDVHLLTRNIMICGSQCPNETLGGCVLVLPGARVFIDGVEGTHLGQPMRGPVFFHSSANQCESSIRDLSLHASAVASVFLAYAPANSPG
jgi:cell migration-inducing and hyaluronan-binding protein